MMPFDFRRHMIFSSNKRAFYRFGGFLLEKHTRIFCMLFSKDAYTIYGKWKKIIRRV